MRREKLIERLRAAWGRASDRARDRETVSALHRLSPAPGPAALDDRTWSDLGMDDVFALLDRTSNPIGQQALYSHLRNPDTDSVRLGRLDAAADRLGRDASLRERIQVLLGQLDDPDAGELSALFFRPLLSRPAGALLFPLLSIFAVLSLAAALLWPIMWLSFGAICLANMMIQVLYRPRVASVIRPLRVLHRLLRTARELGELAEAAPELPQLAELGRYAAALKGLNRATRWLVFEGDRTNEMIAILYGYANVFFLLDVTAFVFSVESVAARQAELRGLHRALGALDVALAVASFRKELGDGWCRPELTARLRDVTLDAVRHPLVAHAVSNSVELDGPGLLVTGSNMSGKTTFSRSVALNAVLAQTIFTCTAARYRAPMLAVRSSIGREDNLLDGRSYYLAEVERIGELIAGRDGGPQQLFVLDELFRGTNTTERVGAACAVLECLGSGDHLVLASTHDLELVELLQGRFGCFHFREFVTDGTLRFDYRLTPGPSSTRNAIALLEVMGYPVEVVARAHAAAAAMAARSEPPPGEAADRLAGAETARVSSGELSGT